MTAVALTQAGEPVVWCVPPYMAKDIIPHVRDMLHKAYRRSGNNYLENIILNELKIERMLLWVAYTKGERFFDAAMVSRVYLTEDGKVCHVIACGARPHSVNAWSKYMIQIEDYARAEGCDKMRVEGRVGWTRLLPSYVRVGVILEKGLARHG